MAEREWFEKDYYSVLGLTSERHRQGDHPRLPQAGEAVPPRLEPRLGGEVQGDLGGLRRARRRRQAQGVRRDPPPRPGRGRLRGRGRRSTSRPVTSATSGTSSVASSAATRRQRAQRGADLETALHLSFRDAVKGVTTTVSLPSNEACHTCKGTGGAPGAEFVTCERCHGRGVINDDQGPFAMSTICPVCQGRGGRFAAACPSCHGTGREPSSRRVNVRLPAGRRGRPAHPAQGQGQSRRPRRRGGRPLRRRPRRARRPLRPARPPRHDDRPRPAHPGDPGHDRRGADPGRAGDAQDPRGHPARDHHAREGARRARARASPRPATSW